MNRGLKSLKGLLAKGGMNMLSIRKPHRHEILEALCRLENGEELTDRDIWILDEYTNEPENFVEDY